MTSYTIENYHNAKLRQILDEHNLFGVFDDTNIFEPSERTIRHIPKDTSTQASTSSASDVVGEAEEKYVPLAGQNFGEEEESEPFPPPSLRHPLSQEMRDILDTNRMHVLPEDFSAIENPDLIPDIVECGVKESLDILAKLLECKNYQHNLAEYWFLDTLASLLRRAQKDKIDKLNQGSLVSWFCQFLKEIQAFDAADRDRVLRRLKANALLLASRLSEVEVLPTPAELGITYKAPKTPSDPDMAESQGDPSPSAYTARAVSRSQFTSNLKNTLRILHYIFDIIGTDFQYSLIRSVFIDTPDYKLINLPHKINFSKSLYAPKPVSKAKYKSKKGSGKASRTTTVRSEILPEEYIELMLLKAKEQQDLAGIEAQEEAAKEMARHILPLSMAVNYDFFAKYWPISMTSKSTIKNK